MTIAIGLLGLSCLLLATACGLVHFELKDLRSELAAARKDHQNLVTAMATTDTPTRVEFQNLQDAVDNLEKAEQCHTNLQIMHAAQMSKLQTDLARMRLDPYYRYKGKEN